MSASTGTQTPGVKLSNPTSFTSVPADSGDEIQAREKENQDALELPRVGENVTRFFFKDLYPQKPCGDPFSLESEALLEKIGLSTFKKDGEVYNLGTGLIIANNRLRPSSDFGSQRAFAEYTMCYIRLSTRQFHRGLGVILQEYFPVKFMRQYIEAPSFKELEKAIDQFQVDLLAFQRAFRHEFDMTDKEIELMLYRIRSYIVPFLDEGWTILNGWTHREVGQKSGEQLTGRSWRLRKLAIHSDNSRLENLRQRILLANMLLSQERVAKGHAENIGIRIPPLPTGTSQRAKIRAQVELTYIRTQAELACMRTESRIKKLFHRHEDAAGVGIRCTSP